MRHSSILKARETTGVRYHEEIPVENLAQRTIHWGRGGLETNENILSTLQALVESTCHLPTNNRLGTFQMFLQVPGQTHDVGTFMENFECNINMCNTFDPP